MGELLKSFTTARAFVGMLFAWVVPTAAATFLYIVVGYESVQRVPAIVTLRERLADLGVSGLWVALGGTALVSLVLALNNRVIYGVLEGYHGWGWLGRRRAETHRTQLRLLAAEQRVLAAEALCLGIGADIVAAAGNAQLRAQFEAELAAAERELAAARTASAERLAERSARLFLPWRRRRNRRPRGVLTVTTHYPNDPLLALPTKLGNRIRAFEAYGRDWYGLETMTLWFGLVSVAPQELLENIQDARQNVEFFIGTVAASSLLAVVSTASAVTVWLTVDPARLHVGPLVLAGLSLLVAICAYQRAVANVNDWYRAVTTLVDVGRKPLAAQLGLQLPHRLADEQRMWLTVSGYTQYGGPNFAEALTEFRIDPTAPPPAAAPAAPTQPAAAATTPPAAAAAPQPAQPPGLGDIFTAITGKMSPKRRRG